MSGVITIQGLELNAFLTMIENAAYKGQMKALEENRTYSDSIDWSKYPESLTIKQIASIYGRQPDTVRRWVKYEQKFGAYNGDRKPTVPKNAVRRVYELELKNKTRK